MPAIMNGELQYLEILKNVIENGELIPNRTGISALTLPHIIIQHDMSLGFPLLTTRKMAWKTVRVELEGFINGITNKKWFQERGCHIWDEWCNPSKIPPGLSETERKKIQLEITDLGPIYGSSWRNFNGQGYDQLRTIVDTLKNNPADRRMLCLAWNPLTLKEQALPACHFGFHLTVTKNKLHLMWFQRSCDIILGLPTNLASYALLLHLLAKEVNLTPGIVSGALSNCHLYENHLDGAREQLKRIPNSLSTIETTNFSSIFNWKHPDTLLVNYLSYPKITFEIAV